MEDKCKWKLLCVNIDEFREREEYFIQNPHTDRLFSNDPSMEINYCPTCGKHIELIK